MNLWTSSFSSDSSGYCRHSTLPANTMFESSLYPQGLHYFTFSVPQRQYSAQVEDPCGKFHANRQRQYRYYTSHCCLLRIIKPCLLQALPQCLYTGGENQWASHCRGSTIALSCPRETTIYSRRYRNLEIVRCHNHLSLCLPVLASFLTSPTKVRLQCLPEISRQPSSRSKSLIGSAIA